MIQDLQKLSIVQSLETNQETPQNLTESPLALRKFCKPIFHLKTYAEATKFGESQLVLNPLPFSL